MGLRGNTHGDPHAVPESVAKGLVVAALPPLDGVLGQGAQHPKLRHVVKYVNAVGAEANWKVFDEQGLVKGLTSPLQDPTGYP
jgi:hypothetical protein